MCVREADRCHQSHNVSGTVDDGSFSTVDIVGTQYDLKGNKVGGPSESNVVSK